MRARRKTLPPKLERVTRALNGAIMEAKKIEELSVQEEVVTELDKLIQSVELARKEIARIMKL